MMVCLYYFFALLVVVRGLELVNDDEFHYANSIEEVEETVTRYEAIVRIANWLWKHSKSTVYSNFDDPMINIVHDMRSDIKACDGEYERFVYAFLYYIFDGKLSEEGYNTCSNIHWNPKDWYMYPNFRVDYEPIFSLFDIIKLAQPLTERHWPCKTTLAISQTEDRSRDYAYVCMGYECTKKYLFFIHPCTPTVSESTATESTAPESGYGLSKFISSLQNMLVFF